MYKGPLIPTIALTAGITLSYLCRLPWWTGIIPILMAGTIYFLILKASKDPVRAFRIGRWHIVWVIILFLGIGLTDESMNHPESLQEAFGGNIPDTLNCEVTGVLTKTYGDRIDAVIKGTNGSGVRIRSGVTEVSAGDIIRIPSSSLQEAASDTSTIGRRIRPMLQASGIHYTGWISPSHIQTVGKSHSLQYIFTDIRDKTEMTIERSHLKKETTAFLNAILMGDKTGLDEETRLTFANGGMAHMLALSGLHIGILAGFIIIIMWPLKFSGRYKWAYAAAIILLWIYVAVTGMAYSSVRACIMTTFAFIGIITERKNFAGNALCSACLLILLADPGALFDAGFQLSVVCVGSLIAFASGLNPIGHRQHPVIYTICGALIATMVATAASWALTSYYFSQVPLMFLPSNLLLLPILPFYLTFAVVFLALLLIGLEPMWMTSCLDRGYEFLVNGVNLLSNGTEFVVEYQIPLWGVILWILMLSFGAYAINRKKTI